MENIQKADHVCSLMAGRKNFSWTGGWRHFVFDLSHGVGPCSTHEISLHVCCQILFVKMNFQKLLIVLLKDPKSLKIWIRFGTLGIFKEVRLR